MKEGSRLKPWIFRLALLGFSLVFGLLCCEVALRILKPELGELVNFEHEGDSYRIFANPTSSWRQKADPDSREKHLVMFNNLTCRQHRDIAVVKPEGTIRIGLFGDSYTVNDRMPVAYSFSEPLDFLFNETGKKVEVLNYGTGGYGTDQSYLQYKETSDELGLDVVIYVCCWNDFVDVVANRLFELDETGALHYTHRPDPSLTRRVARKFYLTYFVLSLIKGTRLQPHDITARVFERDRDEDVATTTAKRAEIRVAMYRQLTDHPEGQLAADLTRALLADWQRIAESRGQDFYLALLPREKSAYTVHREVADELGIEILDLLAEVEADGADLASLFFKKDLHWNAEGNKYGAVHLFKFINEQQRWENPSDDFIRRGLSEYYHSFDPDYVSDEWMLEDFDGPSPEKRDAIRKRYLPLERRFDEHEDIKKS